MQTVRFPSVVVPKVVRCKLPFALRPGMNPNYGENVLCRGKNARAKKLNVD